MGTWLKARCKTSSSAARSKSCTDAWRVCSTRREAVRGGEKTGFEQNKWVNQPWKNMEVWFILKLDLSINFSWLKDMGKSNMKTMVSWPVDNPIPKDYPGLVSTHPVDWPSYFKMIFPHGHHWWFNHETWGVLAWNSTRHNGDRLLTKPEEHP